MILNIEGATDQENCSGANSKILHCIAVTFLIFNIIIFPLDGFQPHHPPFISTIHPVILKHCSLCFHYVKFPPWSSSFNKFFFVQTWFQSCAPGISLKIRFFPVQSGSAREKYVMGQPQFFDIEYQRSYKIKNHSIPENCS